ncbi:hypothetical protein [Geodermatophilus sp. URMC 63]
MPTFEGFAFPFDQDGQQFTVLNIGAMPALRGFRFVYDTSADRHLSLIQLLVGGRSRDLSPNADLDPSNLRNGRMRVSMQDESPSGERFRYLVSHSLLTIPGARRFQIRDLGCVGSCERRLPSEVTSGGNQLLVLTGFKLFFSGGDHHVDRIGVWFRGGDTLHTRLSDKKSDDTFGYLIDFIAIPTAGLIEGSDYDTGIARGTSTGGVQPHDEPLPIPDGAERMLTGWELNFANADHHIRDIGAVLSESEGRLTVMYADRDFDDDYSYRVEWAYIR